MKYLVVLIFVVVLLVVVVWFVLLVLILSYDGFFDNIVVYCGKVYEGKVSVDNVVGFSLFVGKKLVMYVCCCNECEL